MGNMIFNQRLGTQSDPKEENKAEMRIFPEHMYNVSG